MNKRRRIQLKIVAGLLLIFSLPVVGLGLGGDLWGTWFAPLWVVVVFLVLFRIGTFKCPRCGERFNGKARVGMRPSCANCKLSLSRALEGVSEYP